MNFILDSNRNTDEWARLCFSDIVGVLKAVHDPQAENIGEFTTADSERALPLQAADLIAYEAYQYAIWAKGDRTTKVRPAYHMALRNFRSEQDFWLYDEPRFQKIALLAETLRKKDGGKGVK
jgi:hypothetical protein